MTAIDEITNQLKEKSAVVITANQWEAVMEEIARLKSDSIQEFRCHIVSETAKIPVGAENNTKGSSIYNWYRHFLRLIEEYANKSRAK